MSIKHGGLPWRPARHVFAVGLRRCAVATDSTWRVDLDQSGLANNVVRCKNCFLVMCAENLFSTRSECVTCEPPKIRFYASVPGTADC
ncbi:MAG: hypothetical protein KF810_14670 [Rhizobiaceae bacterium]|nr:hypothetical protein [Rhizobiaceae bacterium]